MGNYDDLNEEIQLTLDDIADDLEYWRDQLALGSNERMFTYVAKLYVVYFQFLAQIFDMWSASSSTRFWTSFDQTALSTLQKSRAKIDRAQSKLERAIRDGERAKAQSRYEILEHEIKDMKSQHKQGYEQNQQMYEMLLLVGQQSRRLLVEWDLKSEVLDVIMGDRRRLTNLETGHPAARDLEFPSIARPLSTATMAIIEPEAASDLGEVIDKHKGMNMLRALLEDHMQKVTKLIGGITSLEIDREVRIHLTALLDSPTDRALWVEGPTNTAIPSQNTTTAAVLASIAARRGVPYVMYFNSVSSLQKNYNARDRLGRLQDMLLCLIMQFIAVVPESQLAEVALLHQNLDALGQRTISIDESLALLVALRAAIPSQLMIVIDGCQVLEASGDPEYSRSLYRLYQTICRLGNPITDSSTSDRMPRSYATKICLTTDGYMNTLAIIRKQDPLWWVQYDEETDELGCDETEIFE